MSRQEGALAWIAKGDPAQHEWALRYLYKKQIDVSQLKSYTDLASWVPSMLGASERREFINKMRSAWAQKKFRGRSNGKKAYSFVLTASAKKQLDELAKGQGLSVTGTLEKLISDKLNLQRSVEKQLRQARGIEKARKDSDFHHLAASTLGGLLGTALMDLSKCKILLGDAKVECSALMEPQQSKVEELFKQMKADIFAKLALSENLDIMMFKRLIRLPKNAST
ncbi:Uncharacterised protein [Pseudomonas fluorescens]|uniref:Uncharacterized protein n=1 Tax=Pseudomonas fluorescens TaxID=294 RepID=A0A379IFZ0_PSEFL|nr:hypothetical protein [Pseudomonas fluorescens]SUD31777.1 Uncharacterised protein [Pseudomonas fluorescens]